MNLQPSVFIVDDDEAIRLSFKALLRVWGISAHTFSSAEEFWEAYRESWTGLLLVDLRLPGQSGSELLAELQRRGSSLPALLITAHGEEEVVREAIERGAIGALVKPFQAQQLRNILVERNILRES